MKIKMAVTGLIAIVGLMFAGFAGAQVPPVDDGDTPAAGDQPVIIVAEVTDFDEFGIPLATVQVDAVTLVLPVDNAAAMCDVTVESLNDQIDDEGNASCVATTESAADDDAAAGNLVPLQVAGSTIEVPIDIAAGLCGRDIDSLSEELATGDVICIAASATIIPDTTIEGADTTGTTEGTETTTDVALP